MEETRTVVVSLGHRALGRTLPEQKTATRAAAKSIADLVEMGCRVVVNHGNAPQMGMIHTAMNELAANYEEYTNCPMSVCAAMSQGYIGYDLQNSIRSELRARGLRVPVSTILTQVLVDPYDRAFIRPSRVVGRVLSRDEANVEEAKGNYVVSVDGGYRRIVAAPVPREIVEIETIRTLSEAGQVVIACGGGGIPVMEQGFDLRGASAIVDKDLAAGLLAIELDADVLMILTSTDGAVLTEGPEPDRILRRISVRQARSYQKAGRFEMASMPRKFEASINFVEMGRGRRAVITTIGRAAAGYEGRTGTQIVNEL